MCLYSEREGLRKPRRKTEEVSKNTYILLLKCCDEYKSNLIDIYYKKGIDTFTQKEYIEFDDEKFILTMKNKIPGLEIDEKRQVFIVPDDYNDNYKLDIFDLIEYISVNMKDIDIRWNDNVYHNYKIITSKESNNVFKDYREKINEIFIDSGLIYILTEEFKIKRLTEYDEIVESIEENLDNINEHGLKDLLKESINMYKDPRPNSRQYAIEKIWDAFERLKTFHEDFDKKKSSNKIIEDISNDSSEFKNMIDKEFKELTSIGNGFQIRHHERNKEPIKDARHYDYLFNRCLSLILLAIKYIGDK